MKILRFIALVCLSVSAALGQTTVTVNSSTKRLQPTVPFIIFPPTGLRLDDTDASHQLTLTAGSNLTASRTLSIVTGDVDRTLTFSGNGTVGGAFTGSGYTLATARLLGRTTASSGAPEEITVSTADGLTFSGGALGVSASNVLDNLSSTQGTVLYRSASGWTALAPSTSGFMLTTNGAGANPSWVAAATSGPLPSQTGNSGKLLTTDGSNASWSSAIASSATGFNVAVGVTPFVELEVDSTSTSSPRGIMSAQFNTGTDGARFHFRKARGTRASPTIIVTGDNLGRLVGTGYDGASYLEMASIYFASEGTIATNRVPTNIQFWTATDASPSVLTLAGKFDSAQKLTVSGNITVSGTGTNSFAGRLQIATLSVASTNAAQIEVSSTDSASLPNAFPSLALGNTSNTANNYSYISFYGSAGASTTTSMIVGRTTNQASSYGQQEFQIRGASGFILAQKLTPTVADFTGITTSGTSTTNAAILGKSMGLTENLYVGGGVSITTDNKHLNFVRSGTSAHSGVSWYDVSTETWFMGQREAGATSNFFLYNTSTAANALQVDRTNSAISFYSTLDASVGAGSVYTAGGLYVTKAAIVGSTLAINSITEATTGGAGSLTTAGGIFAPKKIITASSYTSGAPTAGSAGAWKLGQVVTGVALSVSTTSGIRVNVDGADVTLAVLITNP